MIAVLVLIALAGAPPTVDTARICKDAQASALPEDAKVAFDSCLRDEQAARDKLVGRWPHYSAVARSACLGDGGGVPASYVELWTCLEMQPGGSLSLQSGDNEAAPAPGFTPLSPHAQPRPVKP
jgi:hypothetical protein